MRKKQLLTKMLLVALCLMGANGFALAEEWTPIFTQDYEDSGTIATGWDNPNSRLNTSQVIRSGETHYGKINAGSTNGATFTYTGLTNSGIVGTVYGTLEQYKIEFDMAIIPVDGSKNSTAQTPSFTIYDSSNNNLCHWQVTTPSYTAASNSTGSFFLGSAQSETATFTANTTPYFYHITIVAETGEATKMTVKDITANTSVEYTLSENFIRIGKFTYTSGKTQGGLCLDDLTVSMNIEPYTTRASSATTAYTAIKDVIMNSTVKNTLESLKTGLDAYATNDDIVADVSGYVSAIASLETAVSNAQESADNFALLNDLIASAKPAGYVAPEGASTVYTANADVNPADLADAVRTAIITSGTAASNTDISALIVNKGFELGNTLGWTIDGDPATGGSDADNNGCVVTTDAIGGSYTYYTGWNGRNVNQRIVGLPAGSYKLTAKARSWTNGVWRCTIALVANGGASDPVTMEGVNTDLEYTFAVTGNETYVNIGIAGTNEASSPYPNGGSWGYYCDDFTLTYVGQDEVGMAKASLNEEIAAATTVKNSWTPKVGTTPFKYNSTYYDALVTELGEAATVAASGSTTASDYTTAKSELEAAKEAMASSTLILPAADKYYRLYLADNGVSTGKNINMLKYGSGNTTITTTPYPVKFVASGDNYIIENPYDYYIVTPKGNTSAWGAYKDLVEGETMEVSANVWSVIPQEDGTFKMLSEQASWKGWNWYLGTHSTDEGAMVSPYDNTYPSGQREATKTNWLCSEPVELTNVTLSVNATAGWGTFIAPYDNLKPETVKAYTVANKDNGRVYFEESEEDVLSANTPYILSTEEAENVSVALKGIATNGETATYTVNGLVGLMTAGSVPVGSYVMQYQNSNTAFYKVTDSPMTGTAYRCYLDLDNVPAKTSGARQVISFNVYGDDDTTGISQMENGKLRIGESVYNLNGQRIDGSWMNSGIYIHNGRKVVVK